MRQNVYFVMIKTPVQQNDIILKMYAPNNMPTLYKEKLKKKNGKRNTSSDTPP